MRKDTINRKRATRGFKSLSGKEWLIEKMFSVVQEGKKAFDVFHLELGKMLAESIMAIEREEISGPEYYPHTPAIKKWASQQGSVYVGGQKVPVDHLRVRGPKGEIALQSYKNMKDPNAFSEELLAKAMRGISAQKYQETVVEAAKSFGVSAGSVSRRLIDITAKKLQEFRERSLKEFNPFAIFIDTIHGGVKKPV